MRTGLLKKTILAVALVASVVAVAATTASARRSTDRNIVQTAVATGQFKTLAKLLARAGLVHALEQPGPYTVFAPTDAAFKKVPKHTLNLLLRNKAKLKEVLLYHVVAGKITAGDVAMYPSAKTLDGGKLRLRMSGSNVFVNKAKVVKADVAASNGVIQVINRVLIPPVR
jgi:uncharacterized surface protein with fasciclin (FAS1) repeats